MPYAPFDLSGHVALVTGGNSGIGLGMARALVESGASVSIWGTNEEKNAKALAELEGIAAADGRGQKVAAFRCDVGDEEQVDAAFAGTVEALGKVDSCFANAGIGGGAPSFHEFTLDSWRRVTRVNLDGVFLTFRAAAKHMVERGEGGSLVVTSSLSAIEGAARNQAYASCKGAVISMVKGLAVEYARYNIRANAVLPGWIDTPMTEGALAYDRFRDKVLPRIPERRWGEPADFGGIAVYLASQASAYHTGDLIVIDGGYAVF
ncbi:MAG TPA: SDR family NAD(P)-dependent oxidoreductase [Acidimicrobiales bacterium]|jgi:NAD(P)-dependent dehydrogenase (short-subunit alcohol dehydrogenase family)|nr:SDR family NAD(P)-dependent oxidoreductase [Acidimicrobiales bacterium]